MGLNGRRLGQMFGLLVLRSAFVQVNTPGGWGFKSPLGH